MGTMGVAVPAGAVTLIRSAELPDSASAHLSARTRTVEMMVVVAAAGSAMALALTVFANAFQTVRTRFVGTMDAGVPAEVVS
ncbi:hypothetical protein JKY72_00985 [Candidatus Gracilibacteria bacterium]|nr:hypothetical protein [Candidatus Gracilibacteria bacterium]